MSWYRTYRPQTFASLHITPVREAFLKILSSGTFSHAYLLNGPKGTGKTSGARILAKVLNCEKNAEAIGNILGNSQQRIANSGEKRKQTKKLETGNLKLEEPCNTCSSCLAITSGSSLSVTELDAASNRGIDDIRSLRERIGLAPADGLMSVFIIDEVHMLTSEAFNALLKVLEEPPAHVVFVLATTDPQKMPATVVSRCTQILYRKANADELASALTMIAAHESIDADVAALVQIASASDGSFRDAVKLFETIAIGKKKITVADIESSLGGSQAELVKKILTALIAKDTQRIIEVFSLLDTQGMDGIAFQREVLRRLHERLVEYAVANDKRMATVASLLKAIAVPLEPTVPIAWMPFELACIEYAVGGFTNEVQIEDSSKIKDQRSKWQSRGQEMQTAQSKLESEKGQRTQEVGSNKLDGERKQKTEKLALSEVERVESRDQTTPTAAPISDATSSKATTVEVEVREKTITPPLTQGTTAETNEPVVQPTRAVEAAIIEFATVQANWPTVLFQVRAKSVPVEGLLRATSPLRIEGSLLICQANYQFHKEQLEIDRNRHVIEEVLESILGAKLAVEFVTGVKVAAVATSPHSNISGNVQDDPLVSAVSDAFL